jgi:hypothetical protein
MRKPWLWLGILALMIAVLAIAFLAQTPLQVELNELARARDVGGLTAKSASGAWKGRNPFTVIKTNSAYETGKFGWTAISGAGPWGDRYVVFSTPLTSEDVGERLFETDGKKLTKFIDEREDFGWRIEKHDLVVRFDIPGKRAIIDDLLTLRTDRTPEKLMFRMGPNYRVKSIARNEAENAKWSQIGGIVMVSGLADKDQLRVKYEAIVDKPGYAGSIQSNEALLTNDYWYPMIARKPTPFKIAIQGPPDWTAITHGELVSTESKGGIRETKYEMRMPISYWSLNIGPYKTVSEKIEGRTYKCWSMALPEEQMRLQPKFFPLIVKTFETFAPFPFSGYGSCMTPTYGGGALEGYSFVTSGYFSGEDSHELGHTWFGGMVNNTYLTSMWNESFAVWSSGFYLRNADLGNRSERALAYIQTPDINEAAYNAAPLNDSPAEIGPAASTLGYGKGAFVLQMLEQELGTPTFVRACRAWIANQDRTRGGEWEDFESHVSAVSSRDMKWFFDQWVRRPGWADFEIRNVRYSAGRVHGSVAFKGDPYRLNCEVLTTINGKHHFQNVELRSGAFSFPVEAKPSIVSFDPWRRILRKIDANESPATLSDTVLKLRRVDLRPAADFLKAVGARPQALGNFEPRGTFFVGTPDDDPRLANMYSQAQIKVSGKNLTYKGTTINLDRGGFVALIDLPGGEYCAIGAGKILHPPDFGRARLVVFDELGRFLRGESEPKTSGNLVFRL